MNTDVYEDMMCLSAGRHNPLSIQEGRCNMQKGLIAFFGSQDLEATHEFYTGLLGLTLAIDQGVWPSSNRWFGGRATPSIHAKPPYSSVH